MGRSSMQHGKYTSINQADVDSRDDIDDEYEYEYDDNYPARLPSSVRRYTTSEVKLDSGRMRASSQALDQDDYYSSFTSRRKNIPARRTATQSNLPAVQPGRRRTVDTDDIVPASSREIVTQGGPHSQQQRPRLHWLVYVGLAMLVMLLGWVVLSMLANWWQVTQDDWRYGRPRSFSVDQAVGHNDSSTNPSHFIALNLNRHIQIIECPAGDCAKAKVYIGPMLVGEAQVLEPVTLSFKDVTGDKRLDMIVQVEESRFVFINDKDTFRPQRTGENIQLPSP